MQIVSKDNLLVKEARQLKDGKFRRSTGLFMAEGPHLVGELLRSSYTVERLFVTSDRLSDEVRQLITIAKERGIPLVDVSEAVFKSLSETEHPQGIIAVAKSDWPQELPSVLSEEKVLILIADRVQDPGNLGTMIRTAWGFGVKLCVMTPGTVDPYNSKVLRASMGGLFHLPIIRVQANTVKTWAKEQNIMLFAGDPSDKNDLHRVQFPMRTGIIVGNEGAGLSREWEESGALQKIYIPMPGHAESLNVTIAASIMLYEASKQILC